MTHLMANRHELRRMIVTCIAIIVVAVAPLVAAQAPVNAASPATGTDLPGIDPDAFSCHQAGYVNFEAYSNGFDLSANSIGGVHFTTTNGYTWLVGDFATGTYSGKYPNGSYTSQGTKWAWLGPNEGAGRIDFTSGAASSVSILTSANTPVQMEAYTAGGVLLAVAGPVSPNVGTGKMDELLVTSSSKNIAYVVIHDSGNFFTVDSLCTNAPGIQSAISRYVAFGDSVPYGHGLANPGKKSEGGLAPNMGPSSLAYPSLVANSLGVNFTVRSTGCTLSGDNLAVSGAPSKSNTWTGKDTDCHHNNPVPPHKAVSPNELAVDGLAKNPAQLVTIQVGADDIDFAGCLAHLLGIPPNPFTDSYNCVLINRKRKNTYFLPQRVTAELQSLQRGLNVTIQSVHKAAPKAAIIVLGYYQVIPMQTESLGGSSAICGLLEHAKAHNTLKNKRAQADFLLQNLNKTISGVASTYKYVSFLSIAARFGGHEMCTAEANGNSTSWLFDGLWDGAHPTATGQSTIASAVVSRAATLLHLP